MNKIALLPIVVTLATGYAFGDAPKAPPKMTFRTFSAETRIATTDRVTPYRFEDVLLVVIKDSLRCGQKPVDASFSIKAGQVSLHYNLTPAAPDAGNCVLGSEFKIENVPHRDLTVSFSEDHGAPIVAAMQKCPNYNPKTDDVWECLVPAEKK